MKEDDGVLAHILEKGRMECRIYTQEVVMRNWRKKRFGVLERI